MKNQNVTFITLLICTFLSQMVFSQSIVHEKKPTVSAKDLENPGAKRSAVMSVQAMDPVFPADRPTVTQQELNDFSQRLCEAEKPANLHVKYLKEQAELGLLQDFSPAESIELSAPDEKPGQPENMVAVTPTVTSSFNATGVGSGNPPDNCMAISNTGYIVTAVNSSISIYNSSGTNLGNWSLYSFMNGAGAGVVNDFFDPNILYDSGSNRFFLVCVVGRTAANSRIALGFSSSNNPTASWSFYYLTGNVVNNNCWFDFPRIGYSTAEVYVAGNLFNSTTGNFNQAVILQIPKAAGYAGNSLNYQYWSGIAGSPGSICPVSYGATGTYGPGAYFVSHSSGSGTTTNFYDLTNNMSAANEQLLYHSITVPAYAIGPNAAQKNTTEKLDVGDGRIQNAVYRPDYIHYVYCSKANGTQNGIHYDRLNVVNKTIVNKRIYSTAGEAFAYPSVAWIGANSTDKSVVISFQFSKSTSFPGVGALSVDNANAVSSWTTCASGTGFVNQNNPSNSTVSRWGDYTGICRRAGSNPLRIWGGASFGNASNQFTCKIFQLAVGAAFTGGNVEDRAAASVETPEPVVSVYPNPVADDFIHVAIDYAEKNFAEIRILSPLGALMKTPFSGELEPGSEHQTVNVSDLPSGTYFVQVWNRKKMINCEKIFVLR